MESRSNGGPPSPAEEKQRYIEALWGRKQSLCARSVRPTMVVGLRSPENGLLRYTYFMPLQLPELNNWHKFIKREIIIHSQLRHPNVIPLLGIYCASSEVPPMMVMPYMENG